MKLNELQEKYNALQNKICIITPGTEEYIIKSKELSQLESYISYLEKIDSLEKQVIETKKCLTDLDLYEMATAELQSLAMELEKYKQELYRSTAGEKYNKNVILEIRAGTGGNEAALFAYDLHNMYMKYSLNKNWKYEIVNAHYTNLNGVKELRAFINGENVYSCLRYESGVHRVQRVPATESSGRIHTSAATVAVLPEVHMNEIKINNNELRIDTYRSSGPGGQSVNTTDSAVRITHLPTGIVVQQQDEKSQHKNKEKAMKILRSTLHEYNTKKHQQEEAKKRKEQIGTGDRSERIRTYNFPQGRITDHRIQFSIYNIEKMLAGESLDQLIDKLIATDIN